MDKKSFLSLSPLYKSDFLKTKTKAAFPFHTTSAFSEKNKCSFFVFYLYSHLKFNCKYISYHTRAMKSMNVKCNIKHPNHKFVHISWVMLKNIPLKCILNQHNGSVAEFCFAHAWIPCGRCFLCWLLHFPIHFLPVSWEGSAGWPKGLGTCTHVRGPEEVSGFGSNELSSGCYGHLGVN